ncbi:pentapeptide repeat-containing protein [Desulfosarcina sp. OttesenSCG-928-A07]|nr:pentapeptide repeat-containing protein [Desulfosarcina sp. OttesenSCG-928-A07]
MLKRCSEKRDLTEWNAWRESNPREEIFLQGADLSNFYLVEADLHRANCHEAIFFEANCHDANFYSANCHDAIFFEANCQDANFYSANCRGAIFFEANCQNAKFLGANCQEADFRNANCHEAKFFMANCQGARFLGANCQEANFFKANCQEANFEHADCQKANFSEAKCQEAIFDSANCHEANFFIANCQEASFLGANCQKAIFQQANCEEVNFFKANCQNAQFLGANCQKANFEHADCQKANFSKAKCQEVSFNEANCQGTQIYEARLEHALFQNVILNHETRIIRCEIDDQTDFTNTSLSSVIIEPGKRAKLEQNIRRFGWEKWYRDKMEVKKPAHRFLNFLLVHVVRFFWYLSNYGYNTTRVLGWFAGFVIYFALFYTYFPCMLEIKGDPLSTFPFCFSWEVGNFWQMLAFATSTMVTLGFSNINVAVTNGIPDKWGMIVVSLNLMVGYFMLAVLVTRLAILFQTMGPGYVPPRKETESDKKPDTQNATSPSDGYNPAWPH